MVQRIAPALLELGSLGFRRSHNISYRPQLESTQAVYLFEVLQATGDPSSYLDEIPAAALAPVSSTSCRGAFESRPQRAPRSRRRRKPGPCPAPVWPQSGRGVGVAVSGGPLLAAPPANSCARFGSVTKCQG